MRIIDNSDDLRASTDEEHIHIQKWLEQRPGYVNSPKIYKRRFLIVMIPMVILIGISSYVEHYALDGIVSALSLLIIPFALLQLVHLFTFDKQRDVNTHFDDTVNAKQYQVMDVIISSFQDYEAGYYSVFLKDTLDNHLMRGMDGTTFSTSYFLSVCAPSYYKERKALLVQIDLDGQPSWYVMPALEV